MYFIINIEFKVNINYIKFLKLHFQCNKNAKMTFFVKHKECIFTTLLDSFQYPEFTFLINDIP